LGSRVGIVRSTCWLVGSGDVDVECSRGSPPKINPGHTRALGHGRGWQGVWGEEKELAGRGTISYAANVLGVRLKGLRSWKGCYGSGNLGGPWISGGVIALG